MADQRSLKARQRGHLWQLGEAGPALAGVRYGSQGEAGRVISVQDPPGVRRQHRYDAAGRRTGSPLSRT
jgi:YD repeat-containing protein